MAQVLQGTLKFYNNDRGYGVVIASDGSEITLHWKTHRGTTQARRDVKPGAHIAYTLGNEWEGKKRKASNWSIC